MRHHRRRMGFAPATPLRYGSLLRMGFDANCPMTIWPATQIFSKQTSGFSNHHYLLSSQVLDLSTLNQKFTIVINRNFYTRPDNNGTGTQQAVYFAAGNNTGASGKNGWLMIRSRSSGNKLTCAQLEFGFSTGTTTSTGLTAFSGLYTTAAKLNWSQAVCEFDFTVPQIKIYWDGNTTPETINHASNASFPSAAQFFYTGQTVTAPSVGNVNFGTQASPNWTFCFSDAAIGPTALYASPLVQNLTTSIITTLWNSGTPLLYSQLPASLKIGGSNPPTLHWDFQSGAPVADQSGNGYTLTGQGGDGSGSAGISIANLVMAAQERSTFANILRPQSFFYAPRLQTNKINGLPALNLTNGMHGLQCALPATWKADLAGDVFAVIAPTLNSSSVPGTDSFNLWSICCNGSAAPSHGLIHNIQFVAAGNGAAQEVGLTPTPQYRDNFQSSASGVTGQIQSNGLQGAGGLYGLVSGSTYVLNDRAFGTGNASSWSFMQNGTACAIDSAWQTPSNAYNNWVNGITSADLFCLGYLNYNPGSQVCSGAPNDYSQNMITGLVHALYIYGSNSVGAPGSGLAALSSAGNAAVNSYWRTLAGA